MDSKYLFAAAVFLLVGSFQVSANESQTATYDKYLEDAKKAIQNISTTLGLPPVETDPKKIQQNLAEQSQKFADNFKSAVGKLQAAVTDKEGAFQPIIANINQTLASLQTPELQQKTKHFQETVAQSLNQIAEQAGKIGAEINKESQPNGSLHQVGTEFFSKFVEAANNLQSQVQATFQKAQSEQGKH